MKFFKFIFYKTTINPYTKRISFEDIKRVYEASNFDDAWNQYLSDSDWSPDETIIRFEIIKDNNDVNEELN